MIIKFLFWEIELPSSIGIDKVLHFTICFLICSILSIVLGHYIDKGNALAIGATASVIVGICKELYDKRKGGKIDEYDLCADWLGMCFSAFTIIAYV